MNLTNNNKVSYCDKCREKLFSDAEIYIITLDTPTSGLSAIMGGNKQKFRLCKKCFIIISEKIENEIMKKMTSSDRLKSVVSSTDDKWRR